MLKNIINFPPQSKSMHSLFVLQNRSPTITHTHTRRRLAKLNAVVADFTCRTHLQNEHKSPSALNTRGGPWAAQRPNESPNRSRSRLRIDCLVHDVQRELTCCCCSPARRMVRSLCTHHTYLVAISRRTYDGPACVRERVQAQRKHIARIKTMEFRDVKHVRIGAQIIEAMRCDGDGGDARTAQLRARCILVHASVCVPRCMQPAASFLFQRSSC